MGFTLKEEARTSQIAQLSPFKTEKETSRIKRTHKESVQLIVKAEHIETSPIKRDFSSLVCRTPVQPLFKEGSSLKINKKHKESTLLVRSKQLSSKQTDFDSQFPIKKQSNLATFIHGQFQISPSSSVVDLRSVKSKKVLRNSMATMEKQIEQIS